MDHKTAITTFSTERYTLDAMTPAERDAFEEHFVDCRVCSVDVREAAGMTVAPKVVHAEGRFRWQPLMRWVIPAAAVLVIAVGLQRWPDGPREGRVETLHVSAETRGVASASALPAKQWTGLSIEIPIVEGAASFHMELRGPGKPRVMDVAVSEAREEVLWLLRPLPPGSYELVVESVDRGGKRSLVTSESIRVGGS